MNKTSIDLGGSPIMEYDDSIVNVTISQRDALISLTSVLNRLNSPTLLVIGDHQLHGLPQTVANIQKEFLLRHLDTLHIDDQTVLAYLEPHLLADFLRDGAALIEQMTAKKRAFILAVQRCAPPAEMRRFDGAVTSFLCTGTTWNEARRKNLCSSSKSVCFQLMSSILAGTIAVDLLLVKQVPLAKEIIVNADAAQSIAMIIPHRHPPAFLKATLDYASRMAWPVEIRFAIGLDIDEIGLYSSIGNMPNVEFFHCSSCKPVGPYVFRQSMIELANEELLLFQDSDDIPCSDRATCLYTGLIEKRVDMIGSHELEVNEIDHMIRLYRFPLDVSSVLDNKENEGVSDNAAEPFLHATSMIRRKGFNRAGGFSTDRRIANDSQFLLRASFTLKIANADEFLYIRRVHRDALTVAPETHNGNNLRKELSKLWGNDFRRIKRGEISLDDSSLVAIRGEHMSNVYPL